MPGLIDDFERTEAGRDLKEYINLIAGKITDIRVMLDQLVGYKTTYPEARIEITNRIEDTIVQLEALADRYR